MGETYEDVLAHVRRPNLSADAIVLLYARMVELRFPGSHVHSLGGGALEVKWQDGAKTQVYLDNMLSECSRPDVDRGEIVERYLVTLVVDQGKETRGTARNLIPIVKCADYVDFLKDNREDVADHLAADLWIIYALDLPESTLSMTSALMKEMGLTKESLRSQAMENLPRILPEVLLEGDRPSFVVRAGDVYSASVLLLDSVWTEIGESVDGEVVVIVPSRDLILVTGSESSDGIIAIRQQAAELWRTGHHLVSRTMLRRTGGKWIAFD